MFRQKKGQAAMEFLMTYGWAILVVLAAIGALAYFGVLSPEKLVPERTTFSAPFPSSEAAVVKADGTVQVALTNNYGQKIELQDSIAGVAQTDCVAPDSYNITSKGTTASTMNVSNGDTFIISFNCGALTSGDRFEGDITFTYKTPSGLIHTHSGTINGRVE